MSRLYAFGIFLLVSNFFVGKLALPLFAIDFYLGLGIYLFSWLMLFAGLLISGREGWGLAKAWFLEKKVAIRKSISKQYWD